MKKTPTAQATTNSPANNRPAGSKPFGNLTDATSKTTPALDRLAQGNFGKGPNAPAPTSGNKSAPPAPTSMPHPTRRYI